MCFFLYGVFFPEELAIVVLYALSLSMSDEERHSSRSACAACALPPASAGVAQEPKLKDGLPLCGFPFGSVDHLPAFLPELQLSLPSGAGHRKHGRFGIWSTEWLERLRENP